MIAIIQTGGKQFKVSEGDRVKIPKLDLEAGKTLKFDVLLAGDDDKAQHGDSLGKAMVEGKILKHDRHAKVTGIRHKAKKRELTRYGHRQDYTEVEITKIAL